MTNRLEEIEARLTSGALARPRLEAAARCGDADARVACGLEEDASEDLPGLELLSADEGRLLACAFAERVLPLFEEAWPEVTAEDAWPKRRLANWFAAPRRLLSAARRRAQQGCPDAKWSAAAAACDSAWSRVRGEHEAAAAAVGAAIATAWDLPGHDRWAGGDPEDERLRNPAGFAAHRARRARAASGADEAVERRRQHELLARLLLGDDESELGGGADPVKTINGAETGRTLDQHLSAERVELRGAALEGADLTGEDLEGADLAGADLSGASLSSARLAGANLRDATLSGADLQGCSGLVAESLAECGSLDGVLGLPRELAERLQEIAPALVDWWPLGLSDEELGALILEDGRLPSIDFARRLRASFGLETEPKTRRWRVGESGRASFLDATTHSASDGEGGRAELSHEQAEDLTGFSGSFWAMLERSGEDYAESPSPRDAGSLFRCWMAAEESGS